MERGILRTFKPDGTPVEIYDAKALTKEELAALNTYSTDEVDTGKKWIDGRPIYRKYFDLGSMPTTTKTVAHNISNLDIKTALLVTGAMYNSDTSFTLPHISANAFVHLQINATNITITTNESSISSYTGLAVYEYCKVV